MQQHLILVHLDLRKYRKQAVAPPPTSVIKLRMNVPFIHSGIVILPFGNFYLFFI